MGRTLVGLVCQMVESIQCLCRPASWLTRIGSELEVSSPEQRERDDERMQLESDLIASIRKKLPEFVKACADKCGGGSLSVEPLNPKLHFDDHKFIASAQQ